MLPITWRRRLTGEWVRLVTAAARGLVWSKSTPESLTVSMVCLRVMLSALVASLFLFPNASKAQPNIIAGIIPGTGSVVCTGPMEYSPNCVDINYTPVPDNANNGPPQFYDIVAAAPSFDYAGFAPNVGAWDTTGNDIEEDRGLRTAVQDRV